MTADTLDAIDLIENYNAEGDIVGFLESQGFTVATQDREVVRFNAPDRAGIRATFHRTARLFTVTDPIDGFELRRPYRPFEVYALLKHGGNEVVAAAALALIRAPEVTDEEVARGLGRFPHTDAGNGELIAHLYC